MTNEIKALQAQLVSLTSATDDVFEVGVSSTASVNAAARQAAIESLDITPADCVGNSDQLTTRDLLSLAEHMLRLAQDRQGSNDGEQMKTAKPLWYSLDAAIKACVHAANTEM